MSSYSLSDLVVNSRFSLTTVNGKLLECSNINERDLEFDPKGNFFHGIVPNNFISIYPISDDTRCSCGNGVVYLCHLVIDSNGALNLPLKSGFKDGKYNFLSYISRICGRRQEQFYLDMVKYKEYRKVLDTGTPFLKFNKYIHDAFNLLFDSKVPKTEDTLLNYIDNHYQNVFFTEDCHIDFNRYQVAIDLELVMGMGLPITNFIISKKEEKIKSTQDGTYWTMLKSSKKEINENIGLLVDIIVESLDDIGEKCFCIVLGQSKYIWFCTFKDDLIKRKLAYDNFLYCDGICMNPYNPQLCTSFKLFSMTLDAPVILLSTSKFPIYLEAMERFSSKIDVSNDKKYTHLLNTMSLNYDIIVISNHKNTHHKFILAHNQYTVKVQIGGEARAISALANYILSIVLDEFLILLQVIALKTEFSLGSDRCRSNIQNMIQSITDNLERMSTLPGWKYVVLPLSIMYSILTSCSMRKECFNLFKDCKLSSTFTDKFDRDAVWKVLTSFEMFEECMFYSHFTIYVFVAFSKHLYPVFTETITKQSELFNYFSVDSFYVKKRIKVNVYDQDFEDVTFIPYMIYDTFKLLGMLNDFKKYFDVKAVKDVEQYSFAHLFFKMIGVNYHKVNEKMVSTLIFNHEYFQDCYKILTFFGYKYTHFIKEETFSLIFDDGGNTDFKINSGSNGSPVSAGKCTFFGFDGLDNLENNAEE